MSLKKIFEEAIKFGGSSVSSYRTLHGNEGQFQNLHRVYGRAGEPCLNKTRKCNGTIEKLVQSGRSTYYCGTCQRLNGIGNKR
jgi:formamidopyrimidine-DNA glycosylase